MMASLSGLIVLALATALQSAIFSQIHLLQGVADIVLLTLAAWYMHEDAPASWVWAVLAGLMVGTLSALPWWLFMAGYSIVAGFAILLQRKLWRASFFAFFTVVLVGTLVTQGLSWGYLRFVVRAHLPLWESLNRVVFPSLLLNLLFALPVYSLMDEWAAWFFPGEEVRA
jgi:cell shape-determining protein MreD